MSRIDLTVFGDSVREQEEGVAAITEEFKLAAWSDYTFRIAHEKTFDSEGERQLIVQRKLDQPTDARLRIDYPDGWADFCRITPRELRVEMMRGAR